MSSQQTVISNSTLNLSRVNMSTSGNVIANLFVNSALFASSGDLTGTQTFEMYVHSAYVSKGSTFDLAIKPNGFDYSDDSFIKANVILKPVPEPETYALMGMGIVSLIATRRKKRKASQ